MVYCHKCGTQNDEGSEYCKKCGASLKGEPVTRGLRRTSDECFGIPYGGAVFGLVFGSLLVILGLGQVLGLELERYIGPVIIIVIGLLIIVGAFFAYLRRSGRW